MTQWSEVRDGLFCDVPLDAYTANASETEPWGSFMRARTALARGEVESACAVLLEITRMQNVESRHHLQAWHCLRGLGRAPGLEIEKHVLGVVVEVGMDGGLDLLAAYADRTVRFYNYSGAAAVWERPNGSLDGYVDAVLQAARSIVAQIGPWEGPRRPPPVQGIARLNILTPKGLCFGEGPLGILEQDPRGRRLLEAATTLIRKLSESTRGSSPPTRPHGRLS
jgi:hypothetical protein